MSNAYSANIAWQLAEGRRNFGATVTYKGSDYKVTTETISGAPAGESGLSLLVKDGLKQYSASLDPRLFRFSPDEFAPVTEVDCPKEKDIIIWHFLMYEITSVTFDDMSGDTHGINCYALRKIY
jgi:hypothetical protein